MTVQDLTDYVCAVLHEKFSPYFKGEAAIAVAVSGGSDSMALCHLISKYAAQNYPNLRIHALTVDHGLRPESGSEAAQVGANLAGLENVQHHILLWRHEEVTARVQEQARQARYTLIAQHLRAHSIRSVFLGHHQDDQAETILFRLAKGSGLDGLSAMTRALDFKNGLMLLRPLLDVRKAELTAYCRGNTISFCDDPSNQSERFARVRLRRAMPALEAEGLSAKRLALTAQRLLRAREALDAVAEKAFQESVRADEDGGLVIKKQILTELPEEIGIRVLIKAMGLLAPARDYAPRLERVEHLFSELMKPEPFRKRTLSGIIFKRCDKHEKIILTPER